MTVRARVVLSILAFAASFALPAQEPTPTPAPSPTPTPNIDVRMIRLKISAGDLASAESILEVHRAEHGEDGDYVLGVAWVARGAALLGDWKAASEWAKAARKLADERLKTPADYEKQGEAVYALGASIEVQAQVLAATGRKAEAVRFLDASEKAQEAAQAPYNLRARIWKRRNMLELAGMEAPPIHAGDQLGSEAPSLESLRGKPVILYFWWEACGDCKMQAAALRQAVRKYADKGVAFLAPTRFYGKPDDRAEERARIEKAWSELYELSGTVPVPISDSAMVRYGVSATPTFVFVDRKGLVRRYAPTRMSADRLSAEIEALLR
jgi:thiol-disulfide isomerase/thioredoxin